MSLEQAMQELAAALKENTALVRELSVSVDKLILQSSPTEVDRRVNDDHKEVAEKVIESVKKSAPAEAPVSSPSGATPPQETAPAAEDEKTERLIDLMTDVVPVFQKLCVNKGRDAGAAILAKWSVAKLSQVPADKLGELLVDIQKAAA
jgi:hypothetical protein